MGDVPRMAISDIRTTARAEAEQVLTNYWGSQVPIDPIAVARSMGLSVFEAQLGDDVFGMLVPATGGADIYLDRDQPHVRLRFSCAHELGHYMHRTAEGELGDAFIDKRSDSDRGDPYEVYANEFAGSLLMPEAMVRDLVSRGVSDFEAARWLDVSLSAYRYRRQLLGV